MENLKKLNKMKKYIESMTKKVSKRFFEKRELEKKIEFLEKKYQELEDRELWIANAKEELKKDIFRAKHEYLKLFDDK
jgi:septal ring factor EnvC (AmiA/AmiB activator)